MEHKIYTIEEVEEIAKQLRNEDKRIITTNGSYDILHAGHVGFLEGAKKLGDVLIMLINSDESIRRFKGPKRPIIPEAQRARLLAALSAVDYVIIFPQDKPLEYLSKIKGDVHVKGGSWIPERLKEEIDFVAQWGGEYKTLPLEEGLSTTDLIETIRERYDP